VKGNRSSMNHEAPSCVHRIQLQRNAAINVVLMVDALATYCT
jgi:hypothetical protein